MSRFASCSAALLAIGAVIARPVHAQDGPASASACSAPLQEVGNSYSVDTLRLVLDPGYGIKPVDSTSALTALSVVNDDLTLPAPLALPPVIVKAYPVGPSDTAAMAAGAQGFMSEAFVEIQQNGKVKRVGLSQTSLVASIDLALVTAVRKAADEGAFLAFQQNARAHGGYVFVQLRTMPVPEFRQRASDYKRPPSTGVLPRQFAESEAVKPKGEPVTLPIRALRIPLVHLTTALAVTKRGPDPIFPRDEVTGRQDGFVNIEFIVGGDGRVVPGTLRIANAMTTGYAKAVIDALDRYRFKPAMVGACPVAARMTYTYTFEVY